MMMITDQRSLDRALQTSLDLRLKRLLVERRDQLGGAISDNVRFLVVQPGDGLKAIEKALGFNLFEDAHGAAFPDASFDGRWDWIASHGHTFEMVFEGTDAFTHVLLIQNSPMTNRLLRALCIAFAD